MDSPYWDKTTMSLYFCDLFGTHLYRYSYKENKIYQTEIQGQTMPSFFIPAEGTTDKYFVGLNTSVVYCQWDGYSNYAKIIRTLCTVEENMQHHLNQAVAGPKGVYNVF